MEEPGRGTSIGRAVSREAILQPRLEQRSERSKGASQVEGAAGRVSSERKK